MMLTRTRTNGVGRGLTCAMTIILGYQMAELLLDDKVRAQGPYEWASDKYGASTTLLGYYPEAYANYCQELRTRRYDPRVEHHLKPSYQFWKDEACLPEDYTHTTFAVDAKIIGSAGMYAYMLESSIWEFQGVLHAEERQYSIEERERNRGLVRGTSISATVRVRDVSTQTPLLISMRPSTSPVTVELDSDFPELDDCGGNGWQNLTLRTGKW